MSLTGLSYPTIYKLIFRRPNDLSDDSDIARVIERFLIISKSTQLKHQSLETLRLMRHDAPRARIVDLAIQSFLGLRVIVGKTLKGDAGANQ